MLTLKLINEKTEWVIKGLEKKHFPNAKEAIDNVLATDKKRREAQTQLDINLSESKKLAAQIGALMKQGKKESLLLPGQLKFIVIIYFIKLWINPFPIEKSNGALSQRSCVVFSKYCTKLF